MVFRRTAVLGFSAADPGGTGTDAKVLGLVAIGYETDSRIAEQLGIRRGKQNRAPRRPPHHRVHVFARKRKRNSGTDSGTRNSPGEATATEVTLGKTMYQVARVTLQANPPSPVECYVFISLTRPMAFLRQLNRTILVVGLTAILLARCRCDLSRERSRIRSTTWSPACAPWPPAITPIRSHRAEAARSAELARIFLENARRTAGVPEETDRDGASRRRGPGRKFNFSRSAPPSGRAGGQRGIPIRSAKNSSSIGTKFTKKSRPPRSK